MSDDEELVSHKRSSRAILVDDNNSTGGGPTAETNMNGTHNNHNQYEKIGLNNHRGGGASGVSSSGPGGGGGGGGGVGSGSGSRYVAIGKSGGTNGVITGGIPSTTTTTTTMSSRVRARWRCLVGAVVVLGLCQICMLAIVIHLGLQVSKNRNSIDTTIAAGVNGGTTTGAIGTGAFGGGIEFPASGRSGAERSGAGGKRFGGDRTRNGNGGKNNVAAGGSTYIRWGRTSCDTPGAVLVYEGYTGSSYYSHQGGGVDFVCLPSRPQFGRDTNETKSGAFMVGTEFQNAYLHHVFDTSNAGTNSGPVKDLVDHDMPCAVCMAPNTAASITIPGRNECLGDDNWMHQYSGFLMSSHYTEHTSTFICVDGAPEVRPGGGLDHNGATLFLVSIHCGSLPCPPYEQGRELTCVVCSRRN